MSNIDNKILNLEAKVNSIINRDQVIDLKISNMSNSIKLEIADIIRKEHKTLESKIDQKIQEVISNNKEKVSWGMELLRFFIVLITFLGSLTIIEGR